MYLNPTKQMKLTSSNRSFYIIIFGCSILFLFLYITGGGFLNFVEVLNVNVENIDWEKNYRTLIKNDTDTKTSSCDHWSPAPNKNTMAVCLLGLVRDFDLTGPSISKWLLGKSGYDHADVYAISPFDHNSHKLTLLNDRRVVWFEVFNDFFINETLYPVHLLQGLENGQQGLLQQFHMEEKCMEAISKVEKSRNMEYKWILRSRFDSYWSLPPPPLSIMNNSLFYIPDQIADFGGFNDRLSLGSRRDSFLSMTRLSNMWNLRLQTNLNAEKIYQILIINMHLNPTRGDFSFCIMSHHHGMIMYDFSASKHSLGGYYCRPCEPTNHYDSYGKLCAKEDDWVLSWEEIYDKNVPPDEKHARSYLKERSIAECVNDIEQIKISVSKSSKCWKSENEREFQSHQSVSFFLKNKYDDHDNIQLVNFSNINEGSSIDFPGNEEFVRPNKFLGYVSMPDPTAICVRGMLGKREGFGCTSSHECFSTFLRPLNKSSAVYSIQLGGGNLWENEISRFVGNVYSEDLLSLRMQHQLKFIIGKLSDYIIVQGRKLTNVTYLWQIHEQEFKNWKFQLPNYDSLHILKFEIGGLVENIIYNWTKNTPIKMPCQLLIGFNYLNFDEEENAASKWKQIKKNLNLLKFYQDICYTSNYEIYGSCTFFSTEYCIM